MTFWLESSCESEEFDDYYEIFCCNRCNWMMNCVVICATAIVMISWMTRSMLSIIIACEDKYIFSFANVSSILMMKWLVVLDWKRTENSINVKIDNIDVDLRLRLEIEVSFSILRNRLLTREIDDSRLSWDEVSSTKDENQKLNFVKSIFVILKKKLRYCCKIRYWTIFFFFFFF